MGNQCATAPQNAFWEVNVKSWTADHVYSWITDIDKDLKSVARILRKNDITGTKLIEMNRDQRSMEQKLKSLNIAVGDRILLIKEINKLILDNDHETTNYNPNGGDTPTLDFLPTEKNPYAPNNINNNINNNNNNNNNNIQMNDDQSQQSHPGQHGQLQLMNSNRITINHHDLHQTQNREPQNVGRHSGHRAIGHSVTAEFYPGDVDTTEHHQQSYIFQGYPSDDDQQQGAYQFNEHLYEEDMEDNNEDSYFRTSLKLNMNKLNSSNTAPTMSEKQLSSQQQQQQQQNNNSNNNNANNSDLDGNGNVSRNYSENNVRSNNRKTPSLSLRQSLSKIKDLKNKTFRHGGHGGHGSNDFVILETPTPSTSSNRTPLPQLNIGKSNQWTERKNLFGQFQEPDDDQEEDGDPYDDFKTNPPNAQNGPFGVPVLAFQAGSFQNGSRPIRTRGGMLHRPQQQQQQQQQQQYVANDANYFNWRPDAGDNTNYNDIQNYRPTFNIKHKQHNDNIDNMDDSKGDDDDDDDDNNMVFNGYSDDDSHQYFKSHDNIEYDDDLSSESYPSAIAKLTNKHTKTLFMLETTKKYLLSGYLREQDINTKKLLYGIGHVITAYFDDSKMNFEIKTNKLCESKGYIKLYADDTFKFLLNMDHKIELCPTIIRRLRKGNNIYDKRDGANEYNEIELLLECEYLPIKIDKCNVLINIKCICHEIKYQKIDIYSFGTDLLGDNHDYNYNLLNKSGLRMIIPQNDIENLKDLKFEINATVLDIEYDPNYVNYGIVPTYNENLKMSDSISFKWKLSDRILKIMNKDIFKQKFYSSHFDHEHWCLSCYKHDDGQLNICLNLLRLQSNFESINCQSVISLNNNKQIIWSENTNLHCDIQYNNSFKWKLDKISTNKLFQILLNCHDNNHNISINIQIKINKRNKKQNKDIYNEYFDQDNDIEIANDNTNF